MQHYRFTRNYILAVLHGCLILGLAPVLQAQQFKMIRTLGTGMYHAGGEMQMAQVTSSQHLGANDTAFGFYTQVDSLPTLPGSCVLHVNAPGWLGTHMEVDSSINNYFFNRQGDTLFFRPGETNGYSYRMYTYPDGRYLQATQTNDQFIDIIGTIDRVKTFTLEERNTAGQPVSSPWNGKTFSFTERYGFHTIFNLWNFPADTTTYSLIGFTPPALGQPLVNAFSVFDLRKGYEFHYKEQTVDAATGEERMTWEKRLYLNISTDATTDTLWFTQERTRWAVFDTPSGKDTTYSIDTIVDTIALSAYTFLNGNHRQLFAFSPGRYGYSRHYTSDSTGPIFRKEVYRPYSLDAANGCLIPATDTLLREVYGDGLGVTEILDSTDTGRRHRLLVYAQQGIRRWGTPINFDLLLSIDKPTQPSLSLSPNPGRDGFMIQGLLAPAVVTVWQLSGQPVGQFTSFPGQVNLMAHLPAAIYLVEVQSQNDVWRSPWIKH